MNKFGIVLGEPNSINSEILAKSKAYKNGAVIIGSYELLKSQYCGLTSGKWDKIIRI